ncbi:MAG: phosphoribosylanthranilate isomerase [Planctomycetota bacterium]
MAEFEIPFTKVCGVTKIEDLEILARSNVQAVGINLVPTSPRYVEPDAACKLLEAAGELDLYRVVVLRNASTIELGNLLTRLKPDCVQFHGSELPEVAERCGDLDVIKAVSWSGRTEESELCEAWRAAAADSPEIGDRLRAFLVDAYAPAEGGGTGKQARWDLLEPRPDVLAGIPLILAGGLTAKNVYDGILETRCDGVDTASGVELEPGVKSEVMIQQFSLAANHGFARKW